MDVEERAERLVAWIREQVGGAGRSGVVFGLSGGVDSSVVAVLCTRAFPKSTLAVIIPCYSSETDVEHASAVAQQFAIPQRTIVLDGAFDCLMAALPVAEYDPATGRAAQSNVKPRLRMLTLYYLANRLGYLVVGTGNRSELAVGYFTKYGDGGVDILPLGNMVKAEVREMARHLGVPREIIEKPPSAGLWEGQTDEGEMGVTYEELDRYLVSGEARPEVRQRIDAMAAGCAHKKALPALPPF